MRAAPSVMRRKGEYRHVVSAIPSDIPSPSRIAKRRNQGVSSLTNGVARHAELQDQSNDFHSTHKCNKCIKMVVGDRRITAVDKSHNYVTAEISIHDVTRFFTQNKTMNKHPKFGRYFVGHPACCMY
jgi:hypothetical protein